MKRTATQHSFAVQTSSKTQEHYTPDNIIEATLLTYDGAISLDPCSNSKEHPSVPATTVYTAEEDGLKQTWRGKIYVNPPYDRSSKKGCPAWVKKFQEEFSAGRVTEAIWLVKSSTAEKWYQALQSVSSAICLLSDRVKFKGNTEEAPFSSSVIYCGNNPDKFAAAFEALGRIVSAFSSKGFEKYPATKSTEQLAEVNTSRGTQASSKIEPKIIETTADNGNITADNGNTTAYKANQNLGESNGHEVIAETDRHCNGREVIAEEVAIEVRQGRPGFTLKQLNQHSQFTEDLHAHGFTNVFPGTAGRIFRSDVDDCFLARVVGKPDRKYVQTPGKDQRFFKLFMADSASRDIYLVEGVYKAFAIYLCGFNAIAYSGIHGAFDGSKLHPKLKEMLLPWRDGGQIVLGYDNDAKYINQMTVEHNILKLDRLLEKLKFSRAIVQTWSQDFGKDFDEILANKGLDVLKEIVSNTVPIFDWEGISAKNCYHATHKESTHYITQKFMLELIAKYKVLFIKAAMGAGKSFGLGAILKELSRKGCLIISPLRALGRQITKDLREQGVDIRYRDDMSASKNWERIVCCLESISEKGKLKIQRDGSQMVGKILVIDEVVQVISTLLEGSTISKSRSEAVELLTGLLRKADKCIFMSADLTDFHCDIVLKLLGDTIKKEEVCKYENTLPRNKFHGTFIGKVQDGISLALQAVSEGKQVFLGIDSQKTTSTYGTGNLAELFERGEELFTLYDIPKERIIVIDSQTSTTKGHEAYEVIQQGKKSILKNKLLVLCSPSVESGFSLKPEEFSPDLMILCHMGRTSPLGVMQLSMRIRNLEVPRYFCFGGVPHKSLTCGGALTKGDAKKYVIDHINRIECTTRAKDKNKFFKDGEVDDVLNLSLKLKLDDLTLENEFYQLQAIRNMQMLNREFFIATGLRAQGATIECGALLGDGVPVKKALEPIKERRTFEEAEREFQAPNLTDKEVESFKEEAALTVEQQDSMSKYYAQKVFKYDDVTTEELVDRKQGLLEPETNGIWLQEGREYLEFQEQERILKLQNVPLYNSTKLMESGASTQIYKQDILKGALAHKIIFAEELGFKAAFEYALETGIHELWLEPEKITPIHDFVNNLLSRKPEWVLMFGWEYEEFHRGLITIFEKALAEFGYEFADKNKARTKENGKTKQTTFCKTIAPTRKPKLREKRANALVQDIKAKYDKFIETQLWVAAGRKLMSNEPVSKLLIETGREVLLEAAKRLPRTEYGLSKHSELVIHINGFQSNVDIPIEMVTPDNSAKFSKVIDRWIKKKLEIGFDTETYESAIHKEKCEIKNDKWYWLNLQTGKLQQVKPGLDQNQNQVRLMQFSDGDTTYVIDLGRCDAPAIPLWMKELWGKIQKLCKRNTIVGHNLKFDCSSVRKYDLVIRNPYCTMLTTQLLFGDCGAGKVLANGYGLKSVIHNLLGLAVDKTEQVSNWGAETLRPEQIIYAAKDAVYAKVLKELLTLMLDNPEAWGLKEFAGADGRHANLKLVDLENKNIYHTTEMQWRGVPVDVQKLRDRIKKLESIKAEIELDWAALLMPCTPQQAKKITEEMNRRYIDRQHPFDPQEFAEALGQDAENPDLELPTVDKAFSGTGKDIINDNSELPEFQVLQAWRSFNTAISQLSKVLLSAEINNGVCRTEYKPLSGTGRMSCGNEYGLGTPNLQAFVKKAEGKYFGFIPANGDTPRKFWEKPSVAAAIKIRDVFVLSDDTKAFFTEDANASHARLAVGFGKCEFGRSVLDGMDGHSMFAMMALQAMLVDKPDSLDGFPQIRDFVKNLTEQQIRSKQTCSDFKELDKKVAGERFRFGAKTLFYSVLNGAQADKMRKVMAGASGSSVSVEVGTVMFDQFWNLYQGIAQYIKRILAEAEACNVNYGGIEFNITTLPDGAKLAYPRKDGELAVTNLIACQWSRSEATALKKVMASIAEMPQEWGATLINMVHDEVGVTCRKEHWQDAYRFTSDQFAQEYDVFLNGFIPGDEPTEVKLRAKLAKDANYVPTSWADK